MPIVYLARHGSHAEVGRVLSGRSDIALSDGGRAEARWLTRRLAAVPLAAVYSSPRRRAAQTAQAVAEGHELAVQTSDALDEIDFGEWTGQTFDRLRADPRWTTWNTERGSAGVPGGETMAQAVARARGFVKALGGDAPVLCVSHCDVIRGVVASYLGLDHDRLLAFDCDPGSLTTLDLHPGGGRVVALNERPPAATDFNGEAAT